MSSEWWKFLYNTLNFILRMSKNLGILTKNNCLLLVVDVQEKFRPAIHGIDIIINNISKLIKVFRLLKIPIMVTEQYPKGLGETVIELDCMIKNKKIEKVEFSCFDNKEFQKTIKKPNKKNIIIAGIEAHVCVLKTILDGVKNNYNMHMVVDAVSSRKIFDRDIAIKRAEQSNAFITTTEAIIFQLINSSKDEDFKEISNIIK